MLPLILTRVRGSRVVVLSLVPSRLGTVELYGIGSFLVFLSDASYVRTAGLRVRRFIVIAMYIVE